MCLAGGTDHRAVAFDASPNLQVAVLSCERLQGARELLPICRRLRRNVEGDQCGLYGATSSQVTTERANLARSGALEANREFKRRTPQWQWTCIRNVRILVSVEFIETPTFTALIAEYLEDDEYRALQSFLARDPETGDVIPGTGGFRKLRWADRRRGKGKRGGLRVIYYYLLTDAQIWLMTLYDKGEVADLSAAEKRLLKAALDAELARRAARRRPRRK